MFCIPWVALLVAAINISFFLSIKRKKEKKNPNR